MPSIAPSIALARSIILNTTGIDVIAVKRALSRAGYLDWSNFTNVAGPFFMDAVHRFQKDHNIPTAGYGPLTHEALRKTHLKGSTTEWAWDGIAITYMKNEYVLLHTSVEDRIRAAILQAAKNIYAYRDNVAYSWQRPFSRYTMGGTIPAHIDCSGFFTDCHEAAGARSPNVMNGTRMPYNGEAYTGTLLAGGTKVSKDQLKPGDAIFYGFTVDPSPAFPYGSPTHVALYDGTDHVYSNGHHPMGYYPTYYGQQINCYVTYNVVP